MILHRRLFYQAAISRMDLNPPVNRSMRELDRSFFKKTVPVLAAQIEARKTGELLRAPILRRKILDVPKMTNVIRINDGDDSKRLLLLDAIDQGAVSL
jgi:tRNA (guanine37-N1)-methyltransferase